MKISRVLIAFGVIVIITSAVLVVLFFKKDIQSTQQTNSIVEAKKVFRCPLNTEDCTFAKVITEDDEGYDYSKLGFYGTATNSAVYAVQDGKVIINERKLQDEKTVVITSPDGLTAAEYKFLGNVPVQALSEVKTGDIIGVLNARLSYFMNKYNFIFSIYDLKNKKYAKFDLISEPDGTRSILKQ